MAVIRRNHRAAPNLGVILAVWVLAAGVMAGETDSPDDRPRFERLDPGLGLSHNSVHAILQDRTGFLWFGTPDGLNRFDGHDFVIFRHEPTDPNTISSNIVHALLEDRLGNLWIGTEAGVDRFVPTEGRFKRYDLERSSADGTRSRITELFETTQGALLAGFDGLYRYDAHVDRFARALSPNAESPARRELTGIAEDSNGVLWILERQFPGPTLLSRIRLETGDVRSFPVEPLELLPTDLLIAEDDRFWVDDSGPLHFDEREQRFVQVLGASERSAWAIHQLRNGDIWVGSNGGGLTRFGSEGLAPRRFLLGDNPGYLENFVRALVEDRAGTLWVGTHGGVYRFDPNRQYFSRLRHNGSDVNSLSHDAVSAIVEGTASELWIGTYGGGLNLHDLETGRTTRIGTGRSDSDHPSAVIRALATDGHGTIWLGTDDGLQSYDVESRTSRRHILSKRPDALTGAINNIQIDTAGSLWLATDLGLYRYDQATATAKRFPRTGDRTGPSAETLLGLLLDGSSGLWIGAEGRALNRLDFETGVFEHYPIVDEHGNSLASEGIWQIALDPSGDLWLATGSGLVRFDRTRNTFTHFSGRDGLPGTIVYGIAAGDAGRLWLGTNQGLSRVDLADPANPTFQNFDRGDGLGVTEFNRQAALRTSAGELFFGSMEGLVHFDPPAIRMNTNVPPVALTRLQHTNPEGVWSVDPATLGAWTLSYQDASFSFEFAALDFTNPRRNRYSYLLEGFDRDWSAVDGRRLARYTNVPPGRYRFRVRGSNNDGLWNDEGVALAVTIAAPYWHTWWFRGLAGLCVIGLLLGLHRYRVSQATALQQLRLRIASDLHDDLSSDLSGVAIWAELMRRRPHLTDADRQELGQVHRTATNMLDGLRDCVWNINPEHDSLSAMVRRMRLVADRLVGETPCRFVAHGADGTLPLDMTLRRHLFLMFKEALHNAVRHANASQIDITLNAHADGLVLRISDDGSGFDTTARGEGDGLSSLQRRAQQIGAHLEVESTPGAGTAITISTDLSR